MGGPLPRSWACVGLPSCFLLSGLLDRMGGGWVGPGQELGSLHVSFLGCWVGWVGRGQGARRPSCFLFRAPSSWMGRAHKAGLHWPPFAAKAAPIIKLPSCFVFGFLGWMGGPQQKGWAPVRAGKDGWAGAGLPFSSLHSDGWAAAKGLGSRWAAPGSDGWAAANKLGSHHWAPFMCPFWALGRMGGSRLLGRMGGPRPRSCWDPFIFPFWAPPSYFLSGLLGRMGGPRPRSWASFLGSWVGWVGRGQVPSCFLLSAKKLGFHWAPFIFPFCGWAGAKKLGSRWALHVSFLGSWVGWVGRSQEAGSCWAPFMFPSFWVLGRMGGPRQRSWAPIGLPSYFLSGLLGRMGGPAKPVGLPSCFLLSGSWVGWVGSGREAGLPLGSLHVSFFLSPRSDGWAAAKKLGSHWTPFIFPFCAPGSDGWSAAKKLGFRWAPFTDGRVAAKELDACFLSGLLGPFVLPPRTDGPRSQGWAPMASLRRQGCSHH